MYDFLNPTEIPIDPKRIGVFDMTAAVGFPLCQVLSAVFVEKCVKSDYLSGYCPERKIDCDLRD